MDALDLLEQQHREVVDLLICVAEAVSPGRRTLLVARLVQAIEAHSRVEERVFYPALFDRIQGDRGRLYEAFEDHVLVRFAAVNLLATRVTDVHFMARLKLVDHLFRNHAGVEEEWVFPKAKRAIHDEVLDRIGGEIANAHGLRMETNPLPGARRHGLRPAFGMTSAHRH